MGFKFGFPFKRNKSLLTLKGWLDLFKKIKSNKSYYLPASVLTFGVLTLVLLMFQNCSPARFGAQKVRLASLTSAGTSTNAVINCSPQPVSWEIGGLRCDGTTGSINDGSNQILSDATSPNTGRAQFDCVAGRPILSTAFSASCIGETTALVHGACGSADGQTMSSAPSAASLLCSAGTPTSVSGEGPWTWSCLGSGGGQVKNCTANNSSSGGGPVAGVCGPGNGAALTSPPSSGQLCTLGDPTAVVGVGPWSWTCQGLNGGASSPCSARVAVGGGGDEACPDTSFPAGGISYFDPVRGATCRRLTIPGRESLPPRDGSRGISYSSMGVASDNPPGTGRMCLKCVSDRLVLSTNPNDDCRHYTDSRTRHYCEPIKCRVPANYAWGGGCRANNAATDLSWKQELEFVNVPSEAASGGTARIRCDQLDGRVSEVSATCTLLPVWNFSRIDIVYRGGLRALNMIEGSSVERPTVTLWEQDSVDVSKMRSHSIDPSDLDWSFEGTSGAASLDSRFNTWVCVDTGQSMEEKARYGLRRCVPDAAGPALLTVAGGRVEFGGSGNGYIPEGTGAILKGTLSRRSSFTKYVGASSTVQVTLRDRADFRISRNMSIFSQYGGVALNVETRGENGWSNVSVWSSCSVDSPSGITLSYHSGTDSWRFDGDKQKDLPNGTTVKVECSVRSGSMAGTATYEETKR